MSGELDREYFAHGQAPGSLELAFVGDSVYDLFVRAHVTRTGGKVNALSRAATAIVNAGAQAESYDRLLPLFTEDEKAIARRAHNTKQNPPKNADPHAYLKATALEAVLGYLYLTGQRERLNELLRLAADAEGEL